MVNCRLGLLSDLQHHCGMFVVWWKGGGDGRNKGKRKQRDELKVNMSRDLLRVGSNYL